MRTGDNIGIQTPVGPIFAIITQYKRGMLTFAVDHKTTYTFNLKTNWIDVRVIKENSFILKRNCNKLSVKLPIISPAVLAFWQGDFVRGEEPIFIEIDNQFYKKHSA